MAIRSSLRRWMVAVALVLGAGAWLTALGASSKAASAAATGSTVDVWSAAAIGTPIADAPQSGAGVKAAFRYLNSHGGVGPQHQKVVVKVCTTQASPTGELQCAQQAAADPRTIAMVAPIIIFNGPGFVTALQTAGIPIVNPAGNGVPFTTSPDSFPMAAEYMDDAGCAIMTAKARNATKVGFATPSIPLAAQLIGLGATAATKAGLTNVGEVQFPITTTDLTPFVTQLAQNNPQFVVLSDSPQGVGQWLAAADRIGKNYPTCVGDRLIPPSVLIGLGSVAGDFYVAASYPDVTWTGYPVLKAFRAQAQAEAGAGDQAASLAPSNNTEDVLVGWLSSQAVVQAATHVKGAVTRAKLLNALHHTTVTFGKGKGAVLPPINFAKPNPNSSYPRLFNTTLFLKQWSPADHAFVRVPGVPSVDGNKLVP